MTLFILGLVLFLGVHFVRVFVPAQRDAWIANWGEGAWKGTYSIISILGLVLVYFGWAEAKAVAPVYWGLFPGATHFMWLLMVFAFVLYASSALPAGYIKKVKKHPMTLAVIVWSFGHFIVNGDLASMILFGSFFIWGVLVFVSSKRRGYTPPANVHWKWDIVSVLVGLGLWVLTIGWLHLYLFSVAPY